MNPRALAESVLAFLLPEVCALCRSRCAGGFCRPCLARLPRVPSPCPRCALPAGPSHRHDACQSVARVDALLAPFEFAGAVTECIHALKFHRQRSVGRALALALIDACRDRLPPTDLWVPVPLHGARLRARTFNQAEEIALQLARHSGSRLGGSVARRRRATETQSNLPASRRHANVRAAFAIVGRVEGLRVTVVDDVVTTGATVGALAAALAAAGAGSINAIAVARALPAGASAAGATPAAQTA